jgi:response regulator NasT
MLQSFLLLREQPALKADDDEPLYTENERFKSIERLLDAAGFRFQETIASSEAPSLENVNNIDAIIMCVSYPALLLRIKSSDSLSSLPVIWWCDDEPVVYNCTLSDSIDGILYPGMTTAGLHWSLLLAAKHYWMRTQWKAEREQLLAKMEERKWIERAKAILSEVKSISEAEAYEFLRKQAMNERRRMVDVASSIVKVYSLLREQHPRGRNR